MTLLDLSSSDRVQYVPAFDILLTSILLYSVMLYRIRTAFRFVVSVVKARTISPVFGDTLIPMFITRTARHRVKDL